MPKKTASRKKLKALLIITKSNWGGAQRYVYDTAVGLKNLGLSVVVASGGTGEKGSGQGVLSTMLRSLHIRQIFIPHLTRDIYAFTELRALFALFETIRKERPDIVHVNSSKAAFLGALAARVACVPKIIFTVHGWPFNEVHRSAIAKTIFWAASYITALLSHQVIVVSIKDFTDAGRMPFVGRKTTYIPIGVTADVDTDRFAAQKQLLENHPEVESRSIWIGTIAELTHNKNLSLLLDALTGISLPYTACIIGDGELKVELQKIIDARGLGKKVFLAGFKNNAARLLPAFDMFVLPSLKEGLPYTILEAGIRGIPVVASSVGGIPDLIEHEKTGLLVAPNDIKELRRALERLLHEHLLRDSLGRALREKVEVSFSTEHMVQQTLTLYRS